MNGAAIVAVAGSIERANKWLDCDASTLTLTAERLNVSVELVNAVSCLHHEGVTKARLLHALRNSPDGTLKLL